MPTFEPRRVSGRAIANQSEDQPARHVHRRLTFVSFSNALNASPRPSYTIDTNQRGTFVGETDHEAWPAAEAAQVVLRGLTTDLQTPLVGAGSIKLRIRSICK